MSSEHPDWVTIEVPPEVAALGDRGVRAALLLVAIAVSGLVALVLGWRGVAAQAFVPNQVPFVVSAGLGGLALVATGLGLSMVHLGRRAAAAKRAALEDVIRATAVLVDTLAHRRAP